MLKSGLLKRVKGVLIFGSLCALSSTLGVMGEQPDNQESSEVELVQADIDALLRPEHGFKKGGVNVAIDRVAAHGDIAVAPLVGEFVRSDRLNRTYILRSIGLIASDEALDFLDSLIQSEAPEMGDAARSYPPSRFSRLLPILLALPVRSILDQLWYDPLLTRIWVSDPPLADKIIDALENGDQSIERMHLLERCLCSPTGRLPRLERDASNKDEVVRFWRAWLERNVERTRIDWCVVSYEEGNDRQRVLAARCLLELDDPRVMPVLFMLLDDPVVEVRFCATYALGQWSDVWHLDYSKIDGFKENEDCYVRDIRTWWAEAKDDLPKTKPSSPHATLARKGRPRQPYCRVSNP